MQRKAKRPTGSFFVATELREAGEKHGEINEFAVRKSWGRGFVFLSSCRSSLTFHRVTTLAEFPTSAAVARGNAPGVSNSARWQPIGTARIHSTIAGVGLAAFSFAV